MPQNIPSDVQSASAGTTCQTTASNFAYIVTGTVLGVIVALCFAAIMLFYSVMASGLYRYGSARYMGTGPSDPGYGYLDDGTGDDKIEDLDGCHGSVLPCCRNETNGECSAC